MGEDSHGLRQLPRFLGRGLQNRQKISSRAANAGCAPELIYCGAQHNSRYWPSLIVFDGKFRLQHRATPNLTLANVGTEFRWTNTFELMLRFFVDANRSAFSGLPTAAPHNAILAVAQFVR